MQAYSMSTADFYARSSRRSADAMQDMTKHMHNKTVSMHVITIFTLIFLPGTFVAVSQDLNSQIAPVVLTWRREDCIQQRHSHIRE